MSSVDPYTRASEYSCYVKLLVIEHKIKRGEALSEEEVKELLELLSLCETPQEKLASVQETLLSNNNNYDVLELIEQCKTALWGYIQSYSGNYISKDLDKKVEEVITFIRGGAHE